MSQQTSKVLRAFSALKKLGERLSNSQAAIESRQGTESVTPNDASKKPAPLYSQPLTMQMHISISLGPHQTGSMPRPIKTLTSTSDQQNNTLTSDQIGELLTLAIEQHQKGELAQATAQYDAILRANSNHHAALNMSGVALHQSGKTYEGIARLIQAIEVKPDYVGALSNLGHVYDDIGRFDSAVQCYEKALAIKPDAKEILINRGTALHQLGRFAEAIESYDRALALDPTSIEAQMSRARSLMALGEPESAMAALERVIQLNSEHSEAWGQLGILFKEAGDLQSGVRCLQKATLLSPKNSDWFHHLGVALSQSKHYEQALFHFDCALALRPNSPEVLCSKSVTLDEMGRFTEAIQACKQALQLDCQIPTVHLNMGNAYRALGEETSALECYRAAINIDPTYLDGLNNLGDLLRELGQYEESLAAFEQVLARNADYPFLLGLYLNTAMQICDWDRYEKHYPSLLSKLNQAKPVSLPFPMLGLVDSLALQKKAATNWAKHKAPPSDLLGQFKARPPHAKIKIGYFSADFHEHATSFLMAELFERHDRSQFELIGFSFGPDHQDPMRKRLTQAFDRFIDVRRLSDLEVAKLSRELGVDIAVDLKGYTADNRVAIFSYRAAPLQVNYLGYPGTMGVDYIDYLIADHTLIPPSARDGYSEAIAYLPDSYQVNDSTRTIADIVPTRMELGLPENGFVFCCFNNNYKITPHTFDSWMRILGAVPGSVLWLLQDNSLAAKNLKREAIKRGVAPDRLIFADRVPLAEHLARHRAADLFLDTLPCNAHTTTSDALWAGLPVLTLTGEAFAGRVAASLLTSVGLSELITSSAEDYERLAILLAQNPEKLGLLRQSLCTNLMSAPLFDTQRFTHNIEYLYTAMMARYEAALTPCTLEIQATHPQ